MSGAARLRRLRLACWLVACALGVLAAYASRHDMNPDGVSYLDLADAWRRGDVPQAVSLYWSPLYSWLLAAVLALVGPSARAEFPLVHALNVLLYLGALASLEFFLRSSAPRPAAGGEAGPSETARTVWGHALFLVGALGFVTLRQVTPDMLVLAVVLLAAGLLCRLADGAGPAAAAALGALLGLGYLAKAVMLPVAALALVLTAVAAGGGRRAWPRVAAALAAFALVATPWIAAMSSVAGRPTLGENARLNYLWLVDREYHAPFLSYPGARPAPWPLAHPPRRLLDAPATFELAGPAGGTLTIWYDPAYWHRGAPVRLDAADQLRAVARGVRAYARLGLRLLPLAVGLVVLFALLGGRRAGAWRGREGVLLALGAAPLAGYLLIHVEPRYVAGPLVVLGVALLGLVRVPAGAESRRLVGAVVACVVTLQVVPLAVDTVYHWAWLQTRAAGAPAVAAEPWRAATGLAALGVRPGDPVAAAGDYFQAGWARLARVRIVAVVDRREPLGCLLDAPCRARVVAALAPTGARVLVVEGLPEAAAAAGGWVRLGDSTHWAWRLG